MYRIKKSTSVLTITSTAYKVHKSSAPKLKTVSLIKGTEIDGSHEKIL